jgi:hypothetical protein
MTDPSSRNPVIGLDIWAVLAAAVLIALIAARALPSIPW